ncbi:hypothetical protein BBJ28_00002180 [Nothophytophthora sp. Chile5]|nr:hypothetical protein BBJ28_00002180 [Nothophytophthora sp. Chile5]
MDAEESLQAESQPEQSQPSTGGDAEPDDAAALEPTSDDAEASDVSLVPNVVSVDVSAAAQDEMAELQQQQEVEHEPEQDGEASVAVEETTEAADNTEPLKELQQLEAMTVVAEQATDGEKPNEAADSVAVVAVASATEAEADKEEQQSETQQDVPATVQDDSKDSSVGIQSDEAATPVAAAAAAPSAVEVVAVVANTEASSPKQQQEQPQDTSVAVEANVTDPATPEEVPSAAVSAGSATTEEQGAETAVLADVQTAPVDDKNECAISVPAATTASVPHGDDEYDPTNPSPVGTPAASNTAGTYGSCRPVIEQEEYDPDFPSMTSSPAGDTPTAMEVDSSAPRANGTSNQSTSTPAKRKIQETTAASHPSTSGARADSGKENELKRPRHNEKRSPRDEGRRPRRGSGDTTSSPSSSKVKPQEVDHKGLSAAAWDRLMDFQTSGEFRLTQVSRAAFASVGAMPEFAQIAIVARFARTPLKGIRDKNGQLMRIYREYQKENPQIAALQPLDAFLADYKSDPGLFRFGYAPPQPIAGVSSMAVPYQRDQPVEEEVVAKNSPQAKRTAPRPEPQQQQQQGVDEFGRVVHHIRATASESTGSPRTPTQKPVATDPRRNARSRQDPPVATVASQSAAQAPPQSSMGVSSNGLLPVGAGRPLDPRRRDQPSPSHGSSSSSAAGRDPRRRGPQPSQPSSRGASTSGSRGGASNELYERLPGRVKAVIDSMRGEGRLQEPLNDNVISRLLHLPERVALQAVENFSNVDLALVENLQGFLVGIINRVNEKAIAAEKQQQRQQGASPRAETAPASSRGGYSTPSSASSVLGGPPPDGRLGGNQNGNGSAFRGQGGSAASSGRGEAGAGPSPALYERPYEASRDPRRQQQALQRGPPSVGPGPAGRPGSAPNSFTALPVSVQNHILSLVNNGTLSSLEELGGKCYELIGQLSEPLANQVLTRFASANLATVRNRSGFLIGVVKRCRQEYGFN